MFNEATAYVDKLIKEKKLPLLDVKVYKNHEQIYKYGGAFSAQYSGKEKLCMFSCTKVLTAVCAMKLVEEGKIELEAPVSNYIPEFKKAYTLDENTSSNQIFRIRVVNLRALALIIRTVISRKVCALIENYPEIFERRVNNLHRALYLSLLVRILDSKIEHAAALMSDTLVRKRDVKVTDVHKARGTRGKTGYFRALFKRSFRVEFFIIREGFHVLVRD